MTDTRAAFEAFVRSIPGAPEFTEEDGVYSDFTVTMMREAWREAMLFERSECAKVCEEVGPKDGAFALVTAGFAAAIRGRS